MLLILLHFLREGDALCSTGPQGKYRGGQEAGDRRQRKAEAKAFAGASMGKARQGKVSSLGSGGVSDSDGFVA